MPRPAIRNSSSLGPACGVVADPLTAVTRKRTLRCDRHADGRFVSALVESHEQTPLRSPRGGEPFNLANLAFLRAVQFSQRQGEKYPPGAHPRMFYSGCVLTVLGCQLRAWKTSAGVRPWSR